MVFSKFDFAGQGRKKKGKAPATQMLAKVMHCACAYIYLESV